MKTIQLNGKWKLHSDSGLCAEGNIPGSVYSILLENNLMEDPYYRTNELDALKLLEEDYTFNRTFPCPEVKKGTPVYLHCDGLDTVCTIFINEKEVGRTDNMHRVWEFDITDKLCDGNNQITICCHSPIRYIKEKDAQDYVGGSWHAMRGFPHLRKAHCMFGWDWGPRLPDAGIWKDISLVIQDSARLDEVHMRQRHENGNVFLTPIVKQSGKAETLVRLTAPNGQVCDLIANQENQIENPQLWWPNGYGEQPLYTVCVELFEQEKVVDEKTLRIGLRTMTVLREQDEWGESFAQCVNGVPFFAMGADYIPEDNLLSRVNPTRTRKLLEQCVAANFNVVRVWGGGYYPDDAFFDCCDELGLVVWQDFMFACANYRLTYEFEQNIRAEIRDNVRRLRHHASLGLWCGNNEMEMFQLVGEYDGTDKTRSDYIRMFEHIIPEELRELDSDTFYWPASPSSGGAFDEPNDPNRGDVHYWEVWHGGCPFTDYRKYYFRYASEFGFQSFPCFKTIESFTLPEDRNIFSRVMEMHQRNEGANGKIMGYLAQTYLYPSEFSTLLYASQLLQAEAIRYGVEHWRRNRGRCMGAVYWQLNDIWPVASWASVDYYGRWKALHYYAKRFFSPIMISCEEIGETAERISVVTEPSPIETSAKLSVANETRQDVSGIVCWALRNNRGEVLESAEIPLTVPALTSVWLDKIDFDCTDYLNHYMSYEFFVNGIAVSSGTVLFTAPKHYHFINPELSYEINGDEITVSATAYAKSVEISCDESDLVLSDNYFDLNGDSRTIKIIEGNPSTLSLKSVFDIC